jgi:hypothetical protein
LTAGRLPADHFGMHREKQLTRGLVRRLMYVENKNGDIDGEDARIGWVTFSKTGRTVYYRGLELRKARGVRGNFLDARNRDEYWVSGVKTRGSNVHPCESASVVIDDDALEAYAEMRAAKPDKTFA